MISENFTIDQRFKTIKLLKESENSTLFKALDLLNKKKVLLSMQGRLETSQKYFTEEIFLLKKVHSHPRFPSLIFVGEFQGKLYYATEYLGKGLNHKFKLISKKLNQTEAAIIGQQSLQCIKELHTNGYIHRNICPESFRVFNRQVYLCELSTCRKFINSDSNHVLCTGRKHFIGNFMFASMNSHSKIQLSRRDDLESWCYMLSFLLKNNLPWSNPYDYYDESKIFAIKYSSNAENLFRNSSQEFTEVFNYVRALCFEEEPNYLYIQGLLEKISNKIIKAKPQIVSWGCGSLSHCEKRSSKKPKKNKQDGLDNIIVTTNQTTELFQSTINEVCVNQIERQTSPTEIEGICNTEKLENKVKCLIF